ncbi:MAG: glycosyltransferase family 2 protein [Tepidisphaeraceae bacterium]
MSIPLSPNRSAPLPKVSIVMVNWNRYDDVLFALKSIREQDYPNVEIIVVDNGSKDGSPDKLASETDVALIRLCKNCGPSEARNVGLRSADGKYLLLLDSDAILARNTLRVLVDRMEGEPDLGILGCRILNYTSRCIDQWIYAQAYETHGNRPFDTYSFSAAGALIRADLIKDGTGFWEELFIYNEEVDLALQVIRKGFRVGYEPDAPRAAQPQRQWPSRSVELLFLSAAELDVDRLPPLPVLAAVEEDRDVFLDLRDEGPHQSLPEGGPARLFRGAEPHGHR